MSAVLLRFGRMISPLKTTTLSAQDSLLLGLDIGGTKTSAALSRVDDPLVPLFLVRSGSANVQNVSHDEALAHLGEAAMALDECVPGWQSRVVGVSIGAGGVDTEEDAARLKAMVIESFGLSQVAHGDELVHVVHDSRLILAAAGQTSGISLILGTGSVAWGQNEHGLEARSGGWGYLLGDEASAYWFGREAVRTVLRRADRLGPEEDDDALTRLVLSRAERQCPAELIGAFYSEPSRTVWAGFAKCVFDAADGGSVDARDIVERGIDLAAELVSDVADRLAVDGPVVCGGGLIQNQPGFAEGLAERLEQEGLRPTLVLNREPVIGALFLAAQHAHKIAG
jgi:N-acetylglucosamine kinase-like BadF-type ATPase